MLIGRPLSLNLTDVGVSVPLPGLSVLIAVFPSMLAHLIERFSPVAGIKCVDREASIWR